jgi:hypothetical protein
LGDSQIVRQKNMVMSPAGPGTENDCADEGQKQIYPTNNCKDIAHTCSLSHMQVTLSTLFTKCNRFLLGTPLLLNKYHNSNKNRAIGKGSFDKVDISRQGSYCECRYFLQDIT